MKNEGKMIKKGVLRTVSGVVVVLVMALAIEECYAHSYRLNASDTSSSDKAFQTDSRWSCVDDPSLPGVAPVNATGEDEYFVESGYWFRGQMDSSKYPFEFPFKSFTIRNKSINWKCTGTDSAKYRLTFPLLILEGEVNGSGQQVGKIDFGQTSGKAWIDGKVKVLSARETPFYACIETSANWCGYVFDADMSGDATAGIKFYAKNDDYNMQVAFNGDNRSYYGNFQVGKNTWIRFKDADAFGGDAATFDSQALTLGDGSIFEVTTAETVLPASKNRGVFVDGENAVSNVQFRADVDWTLGCALSGSGDILKTGDGKLTIDTDWTLGKLIVKSGCVAMTEGHVAPAETTVESYVVKASCTDVVAGTVLDLGTGLFNLKSPIQIEMSDQPQVISEELVVPVLKFKSSYRLRPCDFVVSGLTPSALRNEVLPTIDVDADGYQIVNVHLLPYKLLSETWKTLGVSCPVSDMDGMWAEAGIPTGGVGNYCVATTLNETFSGTFRVSTYSGKAVDWTFGGASLTMNGATLGLKEIVSRFSNLYVSSSSTAGIQWIGVSKGLLEEDRRQEDVAGNITIMNSTRSSATRFRGRDDVRATVQANLLGNGWIKFEGIKVNETPGGSYFYLTGDNSNYIGGYTVTAGFDKNSGVITSINPARLILDANTGTHSLGGKPFVFMPDALTLDEYGALEVRHDYVYDVPNRGLLFASSTGTEFCISNNATFRVGQRVTFADGVAISKTGSGVFAVKESKFGDGASLTVSEGGIEPMSSDAFDGATLVFASNSAIVVDPACERTSEYGLLMTNSTPSFAAGGKVLLKPRSVKSLGERIKVPYLTVLSSTVDLTNSLSVEKLAVVGHGSKRGKLLKENVVVGGVSCTMYSGVYEREGIVLVVR